MLQNGYWISTMILRGRQAEMHGGRKDMNGFEQIINLPIYVLL
jgi:hypothetical protein